ncbi:GMC oxidoreductase [Sphingobacterium faecium]|uniref:GMC oxidoreductase n=1 Tax=Sphingobacterium faecium TaxID=34087 RepID=UPI00097F2F01|nr:GMC family oxidoreductase [Sphingobacterium faecium]WGQ16737.1 GMC family oxidoreductase [Sphingobacterium faecium]SJN33148.1 Glucose-methanol-choline (GMC) oxidoreductase:NAD binding site [Sphingobacterium faecium PCAi_F2.5]HCU44381.1 GMC family oxidoreductase [Sphingobacterium sp.]
MKKNNYFDAIVIGSGISGGWAAKEFCEKGLKTLVLERGRDVKHIKDYPTAYMDPWQLEHTNQLPLKEREKNPIASKCYAYKEDAKHFFTSDDEQPYIQEKPFDWIRGYQVGGKSLTWAKQTQRWSAYDFEGPARDGFAVDWPIRYADIAPWYSYVEKFVGISGNLDGIDAMPDGDFLPAWEMNQVELEIQRNIQNKYSDRYVIAGRCAHLTKPKQIHIDQGRTSCQARNLCQRGCPFGGYFSSNASTLPWAQKTGNLTLRPHSVVDSVIYDDQLGKAVGVRVIDSETNKSLEFYAKVIFVNASTIATNQILLNSTSKRFPQGIGNDSGILGKYIAFHNYLGSLSATFEGFEDSYYYGRRPTQPIIPNFRNVARQEMDFLRGYASFFGAHRGRSSAVELEDQVGGAFKDELCTLGGWKIGMMMQGETIPQEKNHIRLSLDKKDKYGIPQVITAIAYAENDFKSRDDFFQQGAEMLEACGAKDILTHDSGQNPGLDIHEMGGARMGLNPKTSILNKWNQMHQCPNVFVTDGASMVSTGTQNPSLTYMALTARAVNYAVEQMKKGIIE